MKCMEIILWPLPSTQTLIAGCMELVILKQLLKWRYRNETIGMRIQTMNNF